MNEHKLTLKLFLDEGVPDGVGRKFEEFGHEVIYLRQAIATGSPDDLVCLAAEMNNAILVAIDGDMKQLVKRFGIGQNRFKKLSLIKFSCKESQAVNRLEASMTLIEHEWKVSERKSGRRLFIEIKKDQIKTMR